MCNSVYYVFMSLKRKICHVHTFAEEHEGDHVELGICKKNPLCIKDSFVTEDSSDHDQYSCGSFPLANSILSIRGRHPWSGATLELSQMISGPAQSFRASLVFLLLDWQMSPGTP